MSEPCGSISGFPSVIHSATIRAIPGASLIQIAAAAQRPFDLGRLAQDRHPVRRERQQAVDRVADADPLVAEDVRDELEGLLHLELEVLLGERQLGRRQLRFGDRGDLVGVHQDRPMRVRADFHVAAVLALVAVGVHVAHDRVRDLADGVGEHRDGPDADHLVDGRGERDRRPGHLGEPRAPDAGRDDDDVGLEVALVGADAGDVAVLDVDAGDLGHRRQPERPERLRALAHERAGAERVDDADPGRREAAEDDVGVDVGDHLLDLGGRDELRLDPPRARRRHPALELLHPLGRAGDLDPAALGEDADLLVLLDAVGGQGGHLARMVGQEDEVRGVAGRAARVRERAFLDLDDVLPAEPGEVVDEAVADDAGADDDDPRGTGLRAQSIPPRAESGR